MQAVWELMGQLERFFQLNFLFSGLEVSSTVVLMARLSTLVIFGIGLIWAIFSVFMKFLDCVQTLLGNLGPLPKSFFILLLLIIPLSPDSLGGKWIGYILLTLTVMGLALSLTTIIVAWKYGVDQTLRFINNLRGKSWQTEDSRREDNSVAPENIMRPPIMSAAGQEHVVRAP